MPRNEVKAKIEEIILDSVEHLRWGESEVAAKQIMAYLRCRMKMLEALDAGGWTQAQSSAARQLLGLEK